MLACTHGVSTQNKDLFFLGIHRIIKQRIILEAIRKKAEEYFLC
jgi:hypothetical protein